MNRITAVLLIALLTMTFSNCSQPDKKITLKFKYKQGMHLEYEQDSKKNTQVFIADSLAKNEFIEFKAFVNQTIIEIVDDSTSKINEEDVWQYIMPNKEDSTKLDTVEHKREMNLLVLNNGKIFEFEILNGEENNSALIKNYYEQGLPIFPAVEVSPGYSWTQTTSVVLPEETLNASTTYTVKSLVREMGYDCAIIEYSGNLFIPVEPMKDDPSQRSGIDRIHADGTIYFAYKEGIVIKQTENWHIKGERTVMKEGNWESYSIVSDYDVVFMLKKAEGVK